MKKIILPFEDIENRAIPELRDKTLTITEEQAIELAKELTLVDLEFWDYKPFVGKTYFDAAFYMNGNSGGDFYEECLQTIISSIYGDKYEVEY